MKFKIEEIFRRNLLMTFGNPGMMPILWFTKDWRACASTPEFARDAEHGRWPYRSRLGHQRNAANLNMDELGVYAWLIFLVVFLTICTNRCIILCQFYSSAACYHPTP
jgi:hypothetical protein